MRKHYAKSDVIGIRHYLELEKERQHDRELHRPAYEAAMRELVQCRDCGVMLQRRHRMGDGRCRPCGREAARLIWERTEGAYRRHVERWGTE